MTIQKRVSVKQRVRDTPSGHISLSAYEQVQFTRQSRRSGFYIISRSASRVKRVWANAGRAEAERAAVSPSKKTSQLARVVRNPRTRDLRSFFEQRAARGFLFPSICLWCASRRRHGCGATRLGSGVLMGLPCTALPPGSGRRGACSGPNQHQRLIALRRACLARTSSEFTCSSRLEITIRSRAVP